MKASNAGYFGSGVRDRSRRPCSGSASLIAAFAVLLLVLGMTVVLPAATASAAAATCTGNEIACENQLLGADPSEWDIQGAGDDSIQGFATQMSVNKGEQEQFKIKTDATAYTISIYRLGYYQGKGARKIANVTPSAQLPQNQPACATDPNTEIFDCGTWAVSASWSVPSTAVSGVYIALLERSDNQDASHIPFVVRDDSSHSDLVYQTSDTTWQAYNTYGGSDYYVGLANGRAYKVSYNRPFATRSWEGGRDYLFSNEYPMIRFLESNGYDVSYISGLDTDIRGGQLTNHKTFLSVGHDEYWSAGQRSNVEAARDAGVNLAFFSGNEVYWKTRWETSEDGSNTPNRTLVCYKDTWANTQIDPVTSTSTWRDPRFGVGRPENALTGTAYMSNFSDLAVTVSAQEGSLRLWRNTGLDHPANGVNTQLAPHTVGYESDEDLDNGFRPAGLIRLSTTTGAVPQYLQDFGNTVAAGTTTHHLTMYKASSGALVFSAGTVQWAWGLDTYHDGTVSPVDTRMQQATVNILADMGAQPTTLSTSGVVGATKSTDTTAPTATITAPAAGAITQGSTVTVTGSASDVGGVVAGVEVSLDGGATWHPATGGASFSYTGVLTGAGTSVIRARAIDDSGNIQATPATVGGSVECPCTIFGQATPKTTDANDASPVTLGVRFTSSADGFITGLRFFKSAGNTGTHVGTLYNSSGTALSSVTFTNESAQGWQTATLASAVPITAGSTYTAAYTAPNGHYSADSQFFAYHGATGGPLTTLGGYSNPNGVYTTTVGAPTASYQQSNYYVDAVYSATDPTPLTVVSVSPVNGASSVPVNSAISAVLSRDPAPDSVSWTVTGPDGGSVSGASSYDPATRTATFSPAADLAHGTSYAVSFMADAPGVGPMASPFNWTFKTVNPDGVNGVCPCGLMNDSDIPTVPSANDPNSVELGIAFNSDTTGKITGVRFYKGAGNNGPHAISLWDDTGHLLATAQVGQESAVGWQSASFASPVAVTAGTTYIASYRAPVGRYSVTTDGLAAPIDRAPLHSGANSGRYTYGSAAPLSVSSANYYVDPIFNVDASSIPAVSAITPADNSTSVPVTSGVNVAFDTTVQSSTAQISVTDPSGAAVPGSLSNQTLGATTSFTPNAPLQPGTAYTVTVFGAKNLGGTEMSVPFTSTFTTAGLSGCPCSVLPSYATPTVSDSGDSDAVSLGLQFKSDTDGFITGLRYFRAAANTGSHTGTMYTADGAVLGTLTFQDGAPGWQTAAFTHAIPVTAGTTYVASTYMPNGHYSYTSHFFDSPFVNSPLTGLMGTYAYGANAFPASSYNNGNYYVDVSFSTSDPATPPAAPTGVVATPTNESATVSWTAPTDGGSQITRYTVTPHAGSTALQSTVVSGSPAATSTVIAGLSNGTAYTFTVTATNAAGTGPESAASSAVSPAPTAPGAPTSVSAVAGDASATVSWTAPSADGGATVTGYTVTPYLGTIPQQTTTSTGTSAVVTGLTNGTAYTFTVAATNAIGIGAASGASGAVVPSGSRSCPCALFPATATPAVSDSGDGDAVSLGLRFTSNTNGYILGLRFYRDAANTGSHIGTLYTADGVVLGSLTFADAAPGWQSATFADPVAVTANTTYVASTYMPNGHYSYTSNFFGSPLVNSPLTGITGTFGYGSNVFPASSFNNGNYFVDVSFASDPLRIPGAPAGVSAVGGNAQATVSWSAPADGGSPITGYTVTPYQGTTAQSALAVSVSGSPPATSVTVPGLSNGTSYTFQVTASNAVGAGSAGVSAAVTPATTPDAPAGVSAVGGNAQATVSWTAPAANGGSPITGYVVTPFIGTSAQSPFNVAGSPATVTGLANGTVYTFRVAASNVVGTGGQSTASNAVTPIGVPGAPTNLSAVGGAQSAYVSWSAPTSNGGSVITRYNVTRYLNGVSQGTVNNGTSTNITITGLTNGSTYTIDVTATNATGTGTAASGTVKPVALFVQGLGARATNAAQITATPASNLTAGNRLVVMVGVKNTSTTTAQSVTDAAGNTYTKVTSTRASDNTEMSIWTAPITAGAGTRPLVTARSSASATMAITVTEYAGLSTAAGTGSVDAFKAASGSAFNSGTAASGVTTGTTGIGEVAIGFYLDGGPSRTVTTPSGYTSRIAGANNSTMEYAIADQTIWPTGTTANAQFGISQFITTMPWTAATVVFKRG